MSVIACLRIPPTPAVCDACAQLTPAVEPAADGVWMDWTGGPPVPVLAARLAEALGAHPETAAVPYRLGVAPRRFAAGVLASQAIPPAVAAAWDDLPVQPIPGGYWVCAAAWPAFAARLPVALLPELDPAARTALSALNVRILGDLLTIPRELLQGHLGSATGRLLDWARGHDPRPVQALYPPQRLVQRIPAEALIGADAPRLAAIIGQAAADLAARLAAAGQACARLAVFWGEGRHERRFIPPIADGGQLARAAWQAARRALAESVLDPGGRRQGHPDGREQPLPMEMPGDCVLEITPTRRQGRQTLLWDSQRPNGARHHPALAAIRARYGHTFRCPRQDAAGITTGGPAGGASRAREAVAHYEAMNRFYRYGQ